MSHHGKVWWTELNTRDPEAAKAFYERTMGWTFEGVAINKNGAPPYWIAKRGDETVCGIFTLRSPDFDGVPSHWLTYLAVADIDTGLAEAAAGGGKVLRDKIAIPGFGTFAIVADGTGAAFGMIQPDDRSGP